MYFTLGEIHQQNIIHKDINANNILINKNNEMKITEHLEGTLPFISPEQKGRMNRSIDYRTDLYSLSVKYYQILF